MNALHKWNTYLKERSPLAALTFLSAGIAVSSMAFVGSFDWTVFILGVVITNVILIQMRLGDELKDFENDKIINPGRPLPRGLLSVKEVYKALLFVFGALCLAGLTIGYVYSWLGGLCIILTAIFAWLMFKEFYIAKELSKSPMVYALSHQVIVFPLFGWIGLALDPNLISSTSYLGWLLANFGASFTFEICRKLDPKAHKLAGTYAHHYGGKLTAVFCCIFMVISAIGMNLLGLALYSVPVLFILALTLFRWVNKSETYKIPAGLSGLSSAIILWAPAVYWLFQTWSQK